MKQVFIAVILIGVVASVGYWFLSQDNSSATDTKATDTNEQSVADESTEDYVGLTVAEAEARAAAQGVMFRVVERDGAMLPTTRDFRPGRINAVVVDDVVVSYTVEGQDTVDADSEAAARDDGQKQGDPNANRYDLGDESTADDAADTVGKHDAIIGITVAEAEVYAETNSVPFRVGSVDGEPRPVTMDYRPGRITADIVDGVVVDYSVE